MSSSPDGPTGDPAANGAYTLKVTLAEIRPQIWRRLEISGAMTLKQLHLAIQAVMGWQNYHLYSFDINGIEYGEPDPELPFVRAGSVTIGEVLRAKGTRCTYLYDFGDSWQHIVTVEAVTPGASPEPPVCLDGRRACPPEDCGGVPGYARLIAVLRNPRDPEHDEMVVWTGGHFDPERFDPAAANRRLQRERGLKPRRPKGSRTAREARRSATASVPAGMADDQAALLADLAAAELRARGLAPQTVTASELAEVARSLYDRALSLGLQALAAERGIAQDAASPVPEDGRR